MHDAVRTLYNDALYTLAYTFPLTRPAPKLLNRAKTRTFDVSTQLPAVRTVCSEQAWSLTTNDSMAVSFPILPEFGTRYAYNLDLSSELTQTESSHDVSDLVRRRIDAARGTNGLDLQGNIFVVACTLPDLFKSTSIGLVPFSAADESGERWVGTACSVDTRWASGTSVIRDDYFQGPRYGFDLDQGVSQLDAALKTNGWPDKGFAPADDGTWRRIRTDPQWFALLSPVLTDPTSLVGLADVYQANQTLLEKLLLLMATEFSAEGIEPNYQYFRPITEHMISTLFADGISRSGYQFTSNFSQMLEPLASGPGMADAETAWTMIRPGSPRPSYPRPEAGETTEMTMFAYLTGYVMAANSAFDYLCVGVLCLHACLALSHTVWVVMWRRGSSDAWDTITDLLALAQTSPPPDDGLLANTCAGVRKIRTMSHLGWIEASPLATRPQTPSSGTEQLRLRFTGNRQVTRRAGTDAKKDLPYGRTASP